MPWTHSRWRVVSAQRPRLVVVLLIGLLLSQGLAVDGATAAPALAPPTLTPDRASGQPVGTTIVWTASAPALTAPEYRFTVAHAGQAPIIARDFAPTKTFRWTPLDEGDYQIGVVARDTATPAATEVLGSATFRVASRVTGGRPVVSPTAHPLVALYSIPPCGTGTVQVLFAAQQAPQDAQRTPPVACSPSTSTNVYLVGMRPATTYTIQALVTTGSAVRPGPLDTWTTGALPAEARFPAITTPVPPGPDTSTQDGIVWRATIGAQTGEPQTQLYATDLQGALLWYLPDLAYVARPLPGGDVVAEVTGADGAPVVRVMDPAGNSLRETSLARINEQLAAWPLAPGHTAVQITTLHHEANLLPNGHLVVLGSVERLFPPGTQGSTTGQPVDVLGDAIIDLDPNLQVAWAWNAFDYLDVARPAVLGETCPAAGCPQLQDADQSGGVAQDWLHTNAISYSPADHNLLVSLRHQDWILKLAYQDGQGDGHIIWRLGRDGDFALTNPPAGDAFPWFSHQHGIAYTADGRLITFDNGDTRCVPVSPDCHSRGQVYQLDEAGRRATLLVNADLGNYSAAFGWGQLLQNGNYAFTSGYQQHGRLVFGELEEFDPTGARLVYVTHDQPEGLYRAYRLTTLYDGCCDPPASVPPWPPLPAQTWTPATNWHGALADAPAAAVCAGTLVALARGTDGALYTIAGGASGPGAWHDLGGQLTAAPTVACAGDTTLAVVRGTGDALYAKRGAGGRWEATWHAVGAHSTSAPALARFRDRFFLVTRDLDGALVSRTSPNGVEWGSATRLGGVVMEAPALAVFAGRLYVFARGEDAALYVTSSADGNTWAAWARLGGTLMAAPTASSWTTVVGQAALAVAVRGADGALYIRASTDGTTWLPWQRVDGTGQGAPALAGGAGALYLLAWEADGTLGVREGR